MVQATDQDASGAPRFQVIGSCPTGRKPHVPRRITCPSWPGSTFGSPQEELESIANRKKVGSNLLSLKKGWMEARAADLKVVQSLAKPRGSCNQWC